MKFHVFYYDGGNGTLRSFETDGARSQWVGELTLERISDRADFTVAFTFDGDLKIVNRNEAAWIGADDADA